MDTDPSTMTMNVTFSSLPITASNTELTDVTTIYMWRDTIDSPMVHILLKYILPPIIFLGLIGNSFCFVSVLLRKLYCKSPVFTFYAFLALSDFVVNITHLVSPLEVYTGYGITSTQDILCKIFVYIRHSAKPASSWILISVTVYRLYGMARPLDLIKRNNVKISAAMCMAIIVIFYLLQIHILWTVGVIIRPFGPASYVSTCYMPDRNFAAIYGTLNTTFYSLGPGLLLFFLSVIIIILFIRSYRQHKRLLAGESGEMKQDVSSTFQTAKNSVAMLIPLAVLHILTTTPINIYTSVADLCMKNLNLLSSIGIISMDDTSYNVQTTEKGRLMARYCITYDTMKAFTTLTGHESLSEMLMVISNCHEFADITLRVTDKKTLNSLNKDKNRATIRFPMTGKIKTAQMKVNCLIQTQLGCLALHDFGLTTDSGKIFRAGQRLTRGLFEFMWQKTDYRSILHAALLCKCFKAKLWENSVFVTRQLDGIGPAMSNAFVNAGITSFQKIEDTNARDLELIVNRHAPFGNQIKDAVARLPKFQLCIEQVARYGSNIAELIVSVTVSNAHALYTDSSPQYDMCALLIGDADNSIVYKAKILLNTLLREGQWSKKVEVKRAHRGEHLDINLISLNIVGVDIHSSYTPFYIGPKRITAGGSNGLQSSNIQVNCKGKCEDRIPSTSQMKKSPINQIGNDEADRQVQVNMPCHHKCHNKSECRHVCCKTGLVSRRPNPKSERHDYVNNMRRMLSDFPATPNLQRIKPRLDMDKFSYRPKSSLHSTVEPPRSVVTLKGHSDTSTKGDTMTKTCDYDRHHQNPNYEGELPDLTDRDTIWTDPLSNNNDQSDTEDYGNFTIQDENQDFSDNDDDLLIVEDLQTSNAPNTGKLTKEDTSLQQPDINSFIALTKPCCLVSSNRRTGQDEINPYTCTLDESFMASTAGTFNHKCEVDNSSRVMSNDYHNPLNVNKSAMNNQLGALVKQQQNTAFIRPSNQNRLVSCHITPNSNDNYAAGKQYQNSTQAIEPPSRKKQKGNQGDNMQIIDLTHEPHAIVGCQSPTYGHGTAGHACNVLYPLIEAKLSPLDEENHLETCCDSPTIPSLHDFAMPSSLIKHATVPISAADTHATGVQAHDDSPLCSDDEFMMQVMSMPESADKQQGMTDSVKKSSLMDMFSLHWSLLKT